MMGLDSIWREDGEYLNKKQERFKARSTGCSCCSVELTTMAEVKKEAIDSLSEILVAQRYFNWSLPELIKEAERTEKVKQFKSVN